MWGRAYGAPRRTPTAETGGDVWYSINLPSPTPLRLSTCNADTDFDTQLGVYTGSCSAQRPCARGGG